MMQLWFPWDQFSDVLFRSTQRFKLNVSSKQFFINSSPLDILLVVGEGLINYFDRLMTRLDTYYSWPYHPTLVDALLCGLCEYAVKSSERLLFDLHNADNYINKNKCLFVGVCVNEQWLKCIFLINALKYTV